MPGRGEGHEEGQGGARDGADHLGGAGPQAVVGLGDDLQDEGLGVFVGGALPLGVLARCLAHTFSLA